LSDSTTHARNASVRMPTMGIFCMVEELYLT